MNTRRTNRPRGFAGWRWELLGGVRGRTLEIGCGSGSNFDHYPAGAEVLACDVEPARVRLAVGRRALAPRAVLAADAQHLPWAAGTFDSVIGTLVFCSIPQPAKALAEIHRVLRPGGKLFLLDHVRSHRPGLAWLQDRLAPGWLRLTGGCNLNRDTEGMLRAAGFEVERRQVGYAGLLKLLVARVSTSSSRQPE